jgi:fatty acid desaturase
MAILASAVARRACAQADRAGRLALLAALAAALAVAATGYGVWQAWWMGALWIVASAARAAFGGVAPGPASHGRTERA